MSRQGAAGGLGEGRHVARAGGGFRERLEDGLEVANRNALGEESLEHAVNARGRKLLAYLRHQLARAFGEVVQQLRRLRPREQFSGVTADNLPEVPRERLGGIEHEAPCRRRLRAQRGRNPDASRTVNRVERLAPGEFLRGAPGRHHEELPGVQFARCHLRAADAYLVVVRAESQVVTNPNRRNDKPEFGGHLPSKRADAPEQVAARTVALRQAHQRKAQAYPHRIDGEYAAHLVVAALVVIGGGARARRTRLPASKQVRQSRASGADQQQRQFR